MKYAVVETAADWVVTRDDQELGRFDEQLEALAYVAERLSHEERGGDSYSLCMRYRRRA